MGNTSPDAVTFPDTIDKVGQVQEHLAVMAASVQTAITGLRTEKDEDVADVYGVPVSAVSNGGAPQAISATSFAPVPGISPITMTFERPALVIVTLGAWMIASTGDIRVGIQLSGATVQAPEAPNWGQVMYLANGGGITNQTTCQKIIQVNAGSTTFTAVGRQTGGGTKQCNYATLQVAPIRWVEAP
jgi:hypothetical protein